jgi:hypothetical protein
MKRQGLCSLVIAIAHLGWPQFGDAATPWPDEPKRVYIELCAQRFFSLGVPIDRAKSFCSCVAEGMSEEFGMEKYTEPMQPDPNGSWDDKRLFAIFRTCGLEHR